MLKAIIIDDEESARETLEGLIKKFIGEVDIVAQVESVDAGVQAIKKYLPDVVFLDIQMPLGSGFELFDKLPEIDFEVIFTTAHDQYAIKAIKFSALDYLLKPINPTELREAVEKVRQRKEKGTSPKNMDVFVENIKDLSSQFNRIVLPASEGLIVVTVKEIVRCEGEKNYTTFYLLDGKKIVISKTLKEYENLLADFNFFRIFQSHLINLGYIKKYLKGRGGEVEMADGTVLPVSREKKKELLDKLRNIA